MKVMLVDDHPLFVDGLRNLLTAHGIEVLGTAHDGLEAVEKAQALRPEVVLMDVRMPKMDGLAAVRLIKSTMPEIKVVMLTTSADDEDLFDAIKGGASGYLLKTQDTEEFFALLDDLAREEAVLSPGLATRILHEFARQGEFAGSVSKQRAVLSPREMQVLNLVAQGLTYKEVGAQLFLAERTIKYHMGEIVARLHADNRAQVLEYARREGLIR